MTHVHPHRPQLRECSTHLQLEVLPIPAPEVVDDEKTALEQVVPQTVSFRLVHRPISRLRQIRQGIFEQLRIIQPQNVAAAQVRFDVTHRFDNLGEVSLGIRVVMPPARIPRRTERRRVLQPHKGKLVAVFHIAKRVLHPITIAPPSALCFERRSNNQQQQQDNQSFHGLSTSPPLPERTSRRRSRAFSKLGARSKALSTALRASRMFPDS